MKRLGIMPAVVNKTAELIVLLAAVVLCGSQILCADVPYQTRWSRQMGDQFDDNGMAVSADGLGNVYMSGWTQGSLGGSNAGGNDAFVAKYSAAGNLLWTRQLGSDSTEVGYGVSADGLGNVYISGSTLGSLSGSNAGRYDAFVAKYDAGGNLAWIRQLGTSSDDSSSCVSTDHLGNVYIGGGTSGSLGGWNSLGADAFVAKYDAAGNLTWIRQLGTPTRAEGISGVSTDRLGNVYVGGSTSGSLSGSNAGGNDAFLAKYDTAGNQVWLRQFGTNSNDEIRCISTDALGNVYVSGDTQGSIGGPNAGSIDAFVAKYDAAGNLAWTRQLGTSSTERSTGISADGRGNVCVSGWTLGALGGPLAGGNDAFVVKYDASGNRAWIWQFGTSASDAGSGVSADGQGGVYLTGSTSGSLGGSNAGRFDAFTARLGGPSWATNANGIWSNGNNWTGGSAPTGVGSYIELGNVVTASRTVTLDTDVAAGILTLDVPNAATGYTLGGPRTLTTQVSDGRALINLASGRHTISAPVVLASDLDVITAGVADRLTLSSSITESAGSHGLNKQGPGTLVLNGTCNYTGSTTIEAGILMVNGSFGAASAVTVGPDATLAGSGAVGSVALQSGATITPGDDSGIGRLSISGNLASLDSHSPVFA